MGKVTGVVLHHISCKYVLPEDKFNTEMVWWMLYDLNQYSMDRYSRLISSTSNRQYASYHWLIARDGERLATVHPTYQAYHAGVSEWKGQKNCNGFMLGVGLIGDGETVDYTKEQYNECAILGGELVRTYEFEPDQIVRHSDVAPGRKKDPGPLWDSKRFFRLLDARLRYN